MFLAPLVAGIGAGRVFSVDTLFLALAAFGFFLLRYPLMLAIKSRAPDARAQSLRWSAIYAVLTTAFGGALVLSSRLWLLLPFGLLGFGTLGFYLWLAARRAEMSTLGEWIGILGLALSAPAAYLVATGVLDATAIALYVLNVLYFGGTVLYIKFKVRQQPRLTAKTWGEKLWAGRASIAYHAIVIALVAVCIAFGFIPVLVSIAFIFPMCKVIGGVLNQPTRLNIKRLGFIEAGFTLAFLAIVLLAYS